jgi:DNA-directed RNA polymerase specialized sigma24 family protein
MTHGIRPLPCAAGQPGDRETYVVVFSDHLHSILSRSQHPHVVEETVARERLAVFEHLADISRRYPDPRTYARVRALGDRAVIGAIRAHDVQRGAGSKGARKVASLSDDAQAFAADVAWGSTDSYARIEDLQLLKSLLAPLTKRQRTLLMLVDGHGYSVTEAAALLGIARETAARERSKAYRCIKGHPPV